MKFSLTQLHGVTDLYEMKTAGKLSRHNSVNNMYRYGCISTKHLLKRTIRA